MDSQKPGVGWKLNDAKNVATLVVTTPKGTPLAEREYVATEVDSALDVLGELRAEMIPQVETKPPLFAGRQKAVPDPIFEVKFLLETGGRFLRLRHPAFGWLTFSVPPHSAAEMARALTAAPPPGMETPKLN